MLTADRLRELLDYDPATGVFTWRVTRCGRALAGNRAGSVDGQGYRWIGLDDRDYLEHRLAWLYTYGTLPSLEIDHIDRVRSNNAIGNLRHATHGQNQANSGPQRNNISGIKGIYLTKSGRWMAQIKAAGTRRHLGTFDTAEEASAAYARAAELNFGEFARS